MHLFGSAAVNKLFSDYRSSRDLDYFVTNYDEFLAVSEDFAKSDSRPRREVYYIPGLPNRELTANELYTLKFSHAIYPIHWEKTVSDLRFFQIKGCSLDKELLNSLRSFWRVTHTDNRFKRFSFEDNDDTLFEDNVSRFFDHDTLHEKIKSSPTYLKMVDANIPDQDKFETLSLEDKISLAFEEAFVIALERYNHLSVLSAYKKAQRDLVTRLHPIWLADWILENWGYFFTPTHHSLFKNFTSLREVIAPLLTINKSSSHLNLAHHRRGFFLPLIGNHR